MISNGKLVDFTDSFYDGYTNINDNHFGIVNIQLEDNLLEVYDGFEYFILPPSSINEIFPVPNDEKPFKDFGNITKGVVTGEEHVQLINGYIIENINNCIEKDRMYRFYKSRPMQDLRTYVMKKHKSNCIRCRALGKMSFADVTHHIIHVRDAPHLALTENNLVPLCNTCHNLVHPEKREHFKEYMNTPRFDDERWE